MKVKELRKRKNELQTAISGSVAELVEAFKEETGESPNRISIDMVFLNDSGYSSEYIVGNTCVDVEI